MGWGRVECTVQQMVFWWTETGIYILQQYYYIKSEWTNDNPKSRTVQILTRIISDLDSEGCDAGATWAAAGRGVGQV